MFLGTEIFTIRTYTDGEDEAGHSTKIPGEKFEIQARIAPVRTADAAEYVAAGYEGGAESLFVLFSNSFPGGSDSDVVGPDGRTYQVVGEPKIYGRGWRTRHIETALKAKAPREALNG